MAIPADISEVRTRLAREFRTTDSAYRWLHGIIDPVAQGAEAPTEDD